jgi:O-antigen/teichoic acid export membrane protein
MMFIDKITNIFLRNSLAFLSFFYEKIYKEPMNEEVKNFVKNLSFVGLGTILSTMFSFLFNIIAGRMLGPSGYGSFTLVQSIAMILYIPMLLGFSTAMIKYCAETTEHDRLSSIISTTYITTVVLIVISVIIYVIFFNQIIAIFSVNQEILWLSIIFAVLFVFYTLTTSTLRGLHLMKGFALFQPIFGFILLSTFFIFIYNQPASFEAMVYANYLAFGAIGCVIVIIFLKKYFVFRIDRLWLSTAMRYSNFAVIGALAFTLYSNIDRILINYYMDVESVGIYGVYYYASFAVIGLFSGVFITVFFPTSSKIFDKKLLYSKLNKIIPYLIILGIPGVLISEFIILQFFGKDYPINFPLMILFAISAVVVTWYTMFAWFFNSVGVDGARLTVSGTIIIAIVNLVLNIILIPQIGLYGAIGATILAFVLGLCYNYYFGRKFFVNRSNIFKI